MRTRREHGQGKAGALSLGAMPKCIPYGERSLRSRPGTTCHRCRPCSASRMGNAGACTARVGGPPPTREPPDLSGHSPHTRTPPPPHHTPPIYINTYTQYRKKKEKKSHRALLSQGPFRSSFSSFCSSLSSSSLSCSSLLSGIPPPQSLPTSPSLAFSPSADGKG